MALLSNLQLNREQSTLVAKRQEQLLEAIRKLLDTNYHPGLGSLRIIRSWSDGTFEKILSADLEDGIAIGRMTKAREARLTRDDLYRSNELVDHDASEALHCDSPESSFYGLIKSKVGILYARDGHYVLSLAIDDGRIIAAYRARYCWRHDADSASASLWVDEDWQHKLFLVGLAEALHYIMPDDKLLERSYTRISALERQNHLACLGANSEMLQNFFNGTRSQLCYV